jgi:hypothetical protein
VLLCVITLWSSWRAQFIESVSGGVQFEGIALAAEKGVSHDGDLPWQSQGN